MAVDPAAVLDLAVKTYKVIDFITQIVTDTYEVYKSPDGMTRPDAHMGTLEGDLDAVADGLAAQLDPTKLAAPTPNATAIVDLATKAQAKCDELKTILDTLRVAEGSSWRVAKSLKVVLKSMWKRKDVKALHTDLQDFRTALILRLNIMQIEGSLTLNDTLAQAMDAFQQRAATKHQTEWRVCQRIRNRLYFANIHDREDHISKADEDTLGWFFSADSAIEAQAYFGQWQATQREAARASFHHWLRGTPANPAGDGGNTPTVLHISGKAGSGKSTLLRYLYTHEETKSGLRDWARDRTLLRASFYFWTASSDSLQKSLEGLYKSVLYQVLDERPGLAAYLFHEQWTHIQSRLGLGQDDAQNHSDGEVFRLDGIEKGFRRLISACSRSDSKYYLCLLIDGLDEYGGEPGMSGTRRTVMTDDFRALMSEIIGWSKSQHVKICTSSRPYADFLQRFEQHGAAVLHLHNLNLNDIFLYCLNKFQESPELEGNEKSYTELAESIANRSDGVFLWAYYMVRVMVMSYENDDSDGMRQKKLYEMEPDLGAMYDYMLARVPETERQRSNAFLCLVVNQTHAYQGIPTTWALWLDHIKDGAQFTSMKEYFPRYSEKVMQQKMRIAAKRISLWTCGLLQEASLSGRYQPFHRTAFDYLRALETSGRLSTTLFSGDIKDVYDRLTLADFIYCPTVYESRCVTEDTSKAIEHVHAFAEIIRVSADAESQTEVKMPRHHRLRFLTDFSNAPEMHVTVSPTGYALSYIRFFGVQPLDIYSRLASRLTPQDKFILMWQQLENDVDAFGFSLLGAFMDAGFRSYLGSKDDIYGHPMWAVLAKHILSSITEAAGIQASQFKDAILISYTSCLAAIVPQTPDNKFACFFEEGDAQLLLSDIVALRHSPSPGNDWQKCMKPLRSDSGTRFYYEEREYCPVINITASC